MESAANHNPTEGEQQIQQRQNLELERLIFPRFSKESCENTNPTETKAGARVVKNKSNRDNTWGLTFCLSEGFQRRVVEKQIQQRQNMEPEMLFFGSFSVESAASPNPTETNSGAGHVVFPRGAGHEV